MCLSESSKRNNVNAKTILNHFMISLVFKPYDTWLYCVIWRFSHGKLWTLWKLKIMKKKKTTVDRRLLTGWQVGSAAEAHNQRMALINKSLNILTSNSHVQCVKNCYRISILFYYCCSSVHTATTGTHRMLCCLQRIIFSKLITFKNSNFSLW